MSKIDCVLKKCDYIVKKNISVPGILPVDSKPDVWYFWNRDKTIIEPVTKNATEYSDLIYKPERIIYNNPATIVFWKDGTKTVVKKSPKEKFNAYNAFCAALAKKIYGNNSQVQKIVNSGINQQMKKAHKKKK